MDSKTYLSKQEIADISGLSIGKTKYYIQVFSEYFEKHVIDGNRHPVYNPESVEIVKIIASMIRDNNHNDIRQALNEKGHNSVITYVPEDATAKPTAMIDNTKAITAHQSLSTGINLQAIADTLDAQNQIIDIQAETIRQQKQIIDNLKQRLDNQSEEE